MEMGVDVALSKSQNDTTGQQLLTQHLGKHPSGLHLEKAYFKPIQTDEEKLKSDQARKPHPPILKPTPVIYVNDSELRLSPLTPPYGGGQLSATKKIGGDGETAFQDPGEELKRVSTRGVSSSSANEREEGGQASEATTKRQESINLLQRLQRQSKVPQLGGKVSWWSHCHPLV